MWQTSCSCEKCHRISAVLKKAEIAFHFFWDLIGGLFNTCIARSGWCFVFQVSSTHGSCMFQNGIAAPCHSFISDITGSTNPVIKHGEASCGNTAMAGETVPTLAWAFSTTPFWIMGSRKPLRVVFNPNVISWPSLFSLPLFSGSSSTIFWLVSPEGWLCGRHLR